MSISIILIILTLIISVSGFQNFTFFEKALFRPYLMRQNNEWWRWISGGFLHKDYGHLAVNMISFYFFGPVVESYFNVATHSENGIMFLIFYLSAIIVSGMFDYHRHQNQYSYSALGASGAVSAVIFSFIIFNPFGKISLFFILGIPAWLFGLLFLYYEYRMSKKDIDNVAHNAHFFGAVYGLIFPILIDPQTGITFIKQISDFIL